MLTLNQAVITELMRCNLTRAELDSAIIDGYRINRLGNQQSASNVQNAAYKLLQRGLLSVDANDVLTIKDSVQALNILNKRASATGYLLIPFNPITLTLPWPKPLYTPASANKFSYLHRR